MKENKYDDETFFQKYSEMYRSQYGLAGAGEWPELKKILPPFAGKRVLDLGCGYGWHCRYAAEQRALSVTGIDLSEKMLAVANDKNKLENIHYQRAAMEDLDFPENAFDVVISSLAFHYVKDFPTLVEKISGWIAPGGHFIFSVEHPVFTSYGSQDWYYGENGEILHFPVDRYYYEGRREAVFLGEKVVKYHRTLTTYLDTLLQNHFVIEHVVEPQPPLEMLGLPGMKDEMRRPMMLLVAAGRTPKGEKREGCVQIRKEAAGDAEEIYRVVKGAFAHAEHRDGNEQDLVDALRRSAAFVPELSLVAEVEGRIVGHILFTKIEIGGHTELALAPLSVLPPYQRKGIGTALMREGHRIAKMLGYHFSVVLGSETYYPRAGYAPAKQFGIEAPFEVPDENFMALQLADNAQAIRGTVTYPKEFGI